jgi:hypothetical protein
MRSTKRSCKLPHLTPDSDVDTQQRRLKSYASSPPLGPSNFSPRHLPRSTRRSLHRSPLPLAYVSLSTATNNTNPPIPDLPAPQLATHDPVTGLPQISEARILGFAKHLSEDIGYRTVGTYEHALADTWMLEQAEELKRLCEQTVAESGGNRKLECEVWHQVGSGSHR